MAAINPFHVIWQFPEWHGTAEPDSYRDCFGIRTRMRYMPPPYMELAGKVQGKIAPPVERAGLHDIVEWAGVLLGVLDAKETYTCVELGAGYGPFVVGSGLMAIKRGLVSAVHLIAVEGDTTHVEWMREHFRDNALDPNRHKLICGVVGTYDGTAQFPALSDPAMEWGAEPIFNGCQAGRTPQRSEGFIEKACFSIPTILRDVDMADVIHFDIQGRELDVIRSSIDTLNAKARRLVIGTHGRDLELELMRFLDSAGWTLQLDKACTYQQQPPHAITLLQDGVQVWKNIKLQ